MKKYITLSLSLLFATGMYAQKNEIKSIKKILDKKAPTEADYKELQGLIDATTPYIGNASSEEQAEFYYYKGNYELQQAIKANSVDALTKSVESFNKVKASEANSKRKTFSEKLDKEIIPDMVPQAFQKAIEFEDKKKYREASDVFKAIYQLNPNDTLSLYYAASMSVNVPDYDTALGYYQELLDLGFTGKGFVYKATNKKGEIESFGDNKALMDASVRSGEYSNPKREKVPSKKPQILKNMVLIYKGVNQHSKAEKLLADARKESPKDIDLIIIQTNYHLENNETQKAENLLNEAVSIDPDNDELIYTLAQITTQAGNLEKAKTLYEKVLQVNPKYVNAYIGLAEIVLKDEQNFVDQMNAITGFSSAEMKKYDELKKQRDDMYRKSIPYFEKALNQDPDNQTAISYLVGIYGALDMTDKHNEYKARLKK